MTLTLFYDGFCPLCVAEMRKLQSYDVDKQIRFEDIQAKDFNERFPELDREQLNRRIYGQLADGSMISGLDVTHLAWSLVGKGWVYAPLRWPISRWFADGLYLFFARYRYQISFLLTGKKRCSACAETVCTPSASKHTRSKKGKTNAACASSAASDL